MRRRYLAVPGSLLLVLGVLGACTSFTSDPAAPPGAEGGVDALVIVPDGDLPPPLNDGGDAGAPRCDISKPFGKPLLVPSLNVAGHHSVSARVAGEYLYFASDRHMPLLDFDNADIYRARFQGDAFDEIAHLESVSTAGVEDVAPTESADGLVLYLATGKIDARRIRRATRKTRDAGYGAPDDLPGSTIIPSASQETDPYLVGSTLYFASRAGADGGGDSLIYAVATDAGGPTGLADVVAGPFGGTLRHPVVNATQTELYFIQYIGSAPTVFLARRTSAQGKFTGPVALPALSVPTSTNVNVTSLSADGCDLYLAAQLGSAAPFAIYRARRGAP